MEQSTKIHIPALQQSLVPAPPPAGHPQALGSCLETPPKPQEQNWEFCFAVRPLLSLRVRHKHVEQWRPQECHQGRGQPHTEQHREVGMAPRDRGDTADFIQVIATDQSPAGHLGHQIAQAEYLFLSWGKRIPPGRIRAGPALTFHCQHDGSQDHDQCLQSIRVDDSCQPPCTGQRHSVGEKKHWIRAWRRQKIPPKKSCQACRDMHTFRRTQASSRSHPGH